MTSFKGFFNFNSNTFYLLFLSFIGIVWWVSIWGITDEMVETIEDSYGLSKLTQYTFLAASILLFVKLYPKLLTRL